MDVEAAVAQYQATISAQNDAVARNTLAQTSLAAAQQEASSAALALNGAIANTVMAKEALLTAATGNMNVASVAVLVS